MFRKIFTVVKPVHTLALLVNTKKYFFLRYIPNYSVTSLRFLTNTSEINASNEVTYDEVKSIGKEKRKYDLIIDVRQPKELQETGVIPESVNIPLDQLEVALKQLSNEEFQKNYGKEKPKKDSLIIFSCKSGVRSSQAQSLAEQCGYKKSKNYTGGWLDWEKHLTNK